MYYVGGSSSKITVLVTESYIYWSLLLSYHYIIVCVCLCVSVCVCVGRAAMISGEQLLVCEEVRFLSVYFGFC